MSNIISLFKPKEERNTVTRRNQTNDLSAVWTTPHIANVLCYPDLVGAIDPRSFFPNVRTRKEEDAVHEAALRFFDDLMDDLVFWESL